MNDTDMELEKAFEELRQAVEVEGEIIPGPDKTLANAMVALRIKNMDELQNMADKAIRSIKDVNGKAKGA